jgi:hypothetical protein
VLKLASWRRHGLLDDDELKEFSAETQATILALSE